MKPTEVTTAISRYLSAINTDTAVLFSGFTDFVTNERKAVLLQSISAVNSLLNDLENQVKKLTITNTGTVNNNSTGNGSA